MTFWRQVIYLHVLNENVVVRDLVISTHLIIYCDFTRHVTFVCMSFMMIIIILPFDTVDEKS